MAGAFSTQMALATPTFLAFDGVDVTVDNSGAGTGSRTIKAIVSVPFDLNLREGNTALQFRQKTIQISSRNDVEGVVSPKVRGKTTDAGGMTVILPGDASTWYVHDIVETDAGMHVLKIVDNDGV